VSPTPLRLDDAETFRVTHPFHPLSGKTLRVVTVRRNWGVPSQVYYHDEDGRLRGVPVAWTSLFPEDPVVTFGAGRAPFRLADLLELARLVEHRHAGEGRRPPTPEAPACLDGGVK